MARQLRLQIPGGFHHITARGNNRRALFADDGDRRVFLSVLGEAATRHHCSVHAFCLMTNHIHLVIEDHEAELSNCLRQMNSRYAQRFNRRHGRTGHVFEGRFWNSLLETDSYLTTAVEYVHRNPLEAQMVDDLTNYPWSSYPMYLGLRRPTKFLTTSTVIESYGRDIELLRARTESTDRDSSKERALAARHPAPILGRPAFTERVTASAKRSAATESARRKLQLDHRCPMSFIVSVTIDVFGVTPESLERTVRGQRNRARSAAIYLARDEVGWPLRAIAEHFDMTSSAVTMTSRRFRELLDVEPATAAQVDAIRRRLRNGAQVAS